MKKNALVRLLSYGRGFLLLYIAGVLLITLVSAALQVATAYMLKEMFEGVVALSWSQMLAGFKTGVFVILAIVAVAPVGMWLFFSSAARITARIRTTLFEHIQRLPLALLRGKHSGDLVSRLTNDIVTAEQAYSGTISSFVIQFFSGLACGCYLLILDWRLFIYVVSLGICGLLVSTCFAQKLRRLGQVIQQRIGELTQIQEDLLRGLLVIRSFNLADYFLRKYLDKNSQVYRSSLQRVRTNALVITLNELIGMVLSAFGLIFIGTYLAIKGEVSFGVIVGAVQLAFPLSQMFSSVGQMLTSIQASLAAADRIFEVLDQPLEPESYALDAPQQVQGYVALYNVVFGYQSDRPVLNGINLIVNEGEVVALVGPSGGGKSTILKLLLGFYCPQQGSIVIAGKPISRLTLEQVRAQIAYVPQDAYLFTGTIADNIRYGRPDASTEEIVAAAKAANAHDFITAFEHGYETMVGERGTQLSGGQRQRIAIARAILKDAPILLLDEATSSLDSESESLVQEALERLMMGRTTLVIAHRLSTVQNADRIVVVNQGRVVEEGTHHELLRVENGLYRKLYFQQFLQSEQSKTEAV